MNVANSMEIWTEQNDPISFLPNVNYLHKKQNKNLLSPMK